jgi:hypothetical protein
MQGHHDHLVRGVDLALVDDQHKRVRLCTGARQHLAGKGRHHLAGVDERVGEQAADPLVAHVQPLGRARPGGREFHQVDVTHVQGGCHKESQTFALLLVLPR